MNAGLDRKLTLISALPPWVIASRADPTNVKGLVADQPALHGLLAKVRDLGLRLLLVKCVAAQERCPDEP